MKQRISALLGAVLLGVFLPLGAFATETEEDILPTMTEETVPADSCGEGLTWSYGDGTLTITGNGSMYDYPEGAPWNAYRGEIRTVKLVGNITYIGAGAFRDYDALKNLELGDTLTEVGTAAFSSCDGLEAVSLPRSFRVFGEESFSHCSNLKEIRFAGGMPKFKMNCLWNTYAKLIYPANNPWPLQHIEQLETAFQGRIEFLSSDGTDPYEPTEATRPPETEVPTEAPTEAPTTVPTQAPTEPVTEPVTQPTQPATQPETAPATVPAETRPMVPELPENEYVELPEEEEKSSGILVPVLIGVMAVSLVGIVAVSVLLLRKQPRKAPPKAPRKPQSAPGAGGKKPAQGNRTAGKSTGKKGGKYSR